MFSFHRRPDWQLPNSLQRRVTEEQTYVNRRELLRSLGMGVGLASLGGLAPGQEAAQEAARGKVEELKRNTTTGYVPSKEFVPTWKPVGGADAYPASRNNDFSVRRAITEEQKASTYNNFYEFLPGRAGSVHRLVDDFKPRPWQIRITGEVEEEKTFDVDELAKIAPLEERLYHFRCVEAWSMVVPWTGIPMSAFVKWCKPTSKAKFLRFESFKRPEQAPGQRSAAHYAWPYYEALRMDEALNPMALMVTGIYGHGLPAQHGAPVRVIAPWKYGYKSPKSVVEIKFTKSQPGTFWSDLQPAEYPFLSNIDPVVPHPRWSQATERDLQTGKRIPSLKYNGYGEQVGGMYK